LRSLSAASRSNKFLQSNNGEAVIVFNGYNENIHSISRAEILQQIELIFNNSSLKSAENTQIIDALSQAFFEECQNDLPSLNKKILQLKAVILENESCGDYQKIHEYCESLLMPAKALRAKKDIEATSYQLSSLLKDLNSATTKPFEEIINEFKNIQFPPYQPNCKQQYDACYMIALEIDSLLFTKYEEDVYSFRQILQEKLQPRIEAFKKEADALCAKVQNISQKNFHKLSKEERLEAKKLATEIQNFLVENKEAILRIPSFSALKTIKKFKDSYDFYQFSKLPFSADDKVSELIALPHHIGGEGLKFLTPLQQIMVGETFGPQYHGSAIRSVVHDFNRGKLKLSEKNLAFLLRRVNGYNEKLAIEKKEAIKNNKQVSSELPIQLHTLDLTGYDPVKVNHILTLCPDLKTLKYHRANMEQVNLSNAPNLLEVDLSYAENLSLQHLQALKNVTSLNLLEVELPDEADFSGMLRLTLLNLKNPESSLSAKIVAKIIASIPDTLEELNIEGLNYSLSDLLRFTKLKTLYVGNLGQLHSQNGKAFPLSVKCLHLGRCGTFTNINLQDLALDSLFLTGNAHIDMEQIHQIHGLKELYMDSVFKNSDPELWKCQSLTKLTFKGLIAIKPQSLPPQLQQIAFLKFQHPHHISEKLDFSACKHLQSAIFKEVTNAPSSKIEWLLEHSESVELLSKTDVKNVNFFCIAQGSKLNTLILDDVTLTKEQMGQLEQIQKQFGSTIKIEIRNYKIS
jgi:hypothetical protein